MLSRWEKQTATWNKNLYNQSDLDPEAAPKDFTQSLGWKKRGSSETEQTNNPDSVHLVRFAEA